MDGTIITIISLAVVSSTSIALNFWLCAEARHKNKELNDFIKDAAMLEKTLTDTKAELANEKNHREWAIARIKDQQDVIDQLKSNKVTYKPVLPTMQTKFGNQFQNLKI